MSLYPTTQLDPATAAAGNNDLPSGSLVLIPIDMTTSQMIQIAVAQLSLRQDYSLRLWLSRYPAGLAIGDIFPILRFGIMPVVIHLASQTPPTTRAILVTPGRYLLNILNLTNESNVFSFSLNILT